MGRNELIWFCYLVVNYGFILYAYKKWGKIGLMLFIPLSIIVANIQVNKFICLFGIDATMGNIAYGGIFLVADILSENYGKKYAKHIVSMGFLTMIFMTVIMNIALKISPTPIDTLQPHLEALFTPLYRLTFASLVAYGASSLIDVYSYQAIRKVFPSFGSIWIRNNLSTIFSQIIDSVVFTVIAFIGVVDTKTLLSFIFTTYALKFIVALCDTPFVYIAANWKKTGKIKELIESE
ncbi:queuosine precursor transporter [uncultured Sneathia sp.]|uniref:queuosine precursor transporter n=1 Tax=uncultured Sneathia sp. TaxID=278067 RepID=UPI00259A2D80|nr:queuosine precursor transporter [uncultured Sneathia sp.]